MSRTDLSQLFSMKGTRTRTWRTKIFPWRDWEGPTTIVTENCTYDSGFITRSGNVTPGYQTACDSGQLPENAFTFSKTFDSHCLGSDRYSRASYPLEVSDTHGVFEDFTCIMAPDTTIDSLLKSNLDNKVRQKLLERVKDQDVNLGVIWGEREQTFRLLGDALKRLGEAYHQARSGNFGGAARTLVGETGRVKASVARNWLELQYGWQPLLSDIYGLCKTAHKAARRQRYVTVKYTGKIQDSFSDTLTISEGVHHRTSEALYASSARVKMQSSSMALSTAAELGLLNPALVAWELVPFSFVIDWALPIGSFLGQIDASVGWSFVNASATIFDKTSAKTTKVAQYLPNEYTYRECNVQRRMERLYVRREPISSWSGLLSLPYLKDPTSLVHVLNALALLKTSKR